MSRVINSCLVSLNNIGGVFCDYAAGMFVQAGVLVVLLLIIDFLLRKQVRAALRYCLWMLVFVKLVLPPTLCLPTGIGYWCGDYVSSGSPVLGHISDVVQPRAVGTTAPQDLTPSADIPEAELLRKLPGTAPAVTSAVSSLAPLTCRAIVFLVWLVCVLVLFSLLIKRMFFVRRLIAQSMPADGRLLDILKQCRRELGIARAVELRLSDSTPGPAVCGFFRPTILMPTVLFEKLTSDKLRTVLIHEFAHIKRGDLWVNSVQTFLQVIYFYNPFVWLANVVVRRIREQAVDEMVLVALGAEAKSYSNTLIDIAEMAFWKANLSLRLVGVVESKKALQRRIKHMLTRPIPKTARVGVLGMIAIIIVAAVLLPMARAEKSNKDATVTPQATGAGVTEKAPPAGESDTIVDPKTGVKVVLAKTISGPNNLIEHLNKLTLSPDGRFLLWWGRVVPLDGTKAFYYTENGDDREVAVSPNGRYIAHGEEAVWLQPVSPETLRPNGPPKKLLDLKGERLAETWGRPEAIRWTWDSETVFFRTRDPAGKYSQYGFSAATGACVNFPDGVARGLRSPDGKCVAFTDGNPGFWVQTIGEGTARNLCGEGPAPLCWSGDGRWLIGIGRGGGVVRFTQYPDGQEYLVSLPTELESSSACVGTSADKKMLFFYQPGYELKDRVKVASAANAPLKDVDVKALPRCQWTPDGKSLFFTAYTAQGEAALLRSPLSGEEPVQFTIKLDVSGKVGSLSVSPDGKWLLFAVMGQRAVDLGVVPLSVASHEATGPATVVFRNAFYPAVWSPDSTRVALTSNDDPGDGEGISIAFTDGKAPLRLTQTTANERDLKWSPDGSMLAFVSDSGGAKELKVVPTAGGETMSIRKWDDAEEDGMMEWEWSPDSKSLTIAEAGMLVRQALSGGKAESVANLKECGIEWTSWLSWSPDGSHLALVCNKPGNKDLRVWGQLLFVRVEGGRLQQTAGVDLRGGNWNYEWSPDSEHVAYTCEDAVAVRPAGRLYALAVDDILERISAGAIPPTRRQTATVEKQPTETGTVPQGEPIAGPVFTDSFDNGPSKHWQILDSNTEMLPPPGHATVNGELMLSNSSVRLDQIDWPDYVVTVRVCMKESIASGEGVFGIQTRTTPCAFGVRNRDRYNLVITCLDGLPTGLYLGINYRDPSNTGHKANLGRSSYTIVPDKWYTLEFEVRGQKLRGYLDGKLMVEATDERLSKGGIWLSTWRSRALFDDFSVRQLP
jgi:beta-lactamase regulating signal transducer with metallopeptidase domain/WD40 repeat protein